MEEDDILQEIINEGFLEDCSKQTLQEELEDVLTSDTYEINEDAVLHGSIASIIERLKEIDIMDEDIDDFVIYKEDIDGIIESVDRSFFHRVALDTKETIKTYEGTDRITFYIEDGTSTWLVTITDVDVVCDELKI